MIYIQSIIYDTKSRMAIRDMIQFYDTKVLSTIPCNITAAAYGHRYHSSETVEG